MTPNELTQGIMDFAKQCLASHGKLAPLAAVIVSDNGTNSYLLPESGPEALAKGLSALTEACRVSKAKYTVMISECIVRDDVNVPFVGKEVINVHAFGPETNFAILQPFHKEGEKVVFDGEPEMTKSVLATKLQPWWPVAPVSVN